MVICSNCQHPVDETATDTCPICKTSLNAKAVAEDAPAAPVMAQPIMTTAATSPVSSLPPPAPATGGFTRKMTLSGEYIDVPNPTNPVATRPGTVPPPTGNGASHRGGSAARPRSKETTASKSSSGTVALVLVLLLIVGCVGGYVWWIHRTNPQSQAQKYVDALKSQDWNTVYSLTDFSTQDKQKYPDATSFSTAMKSAPFLSVILKSLSSASMTAQPPTSNDGSTAVVPVNLTISLAGHTFNHSINLNMVNKGGFWMVKRAPSMGM